MKIEMLVVFLVVTAFVIVPYISLMIFGSDNTKRILKQFKKEAAANGLKITEQEGWNRHRIGYDKEKGILLFTQLQDEKISSRVFDLKNFSRIEVLKESVNSYQDKKKVEILHKMSLGLFSYADTPEVLITFFDYEEDPNQNYESDRASKWKGNLSGCLQKAGSLRPAA